jgi:hypothetical protein
MRKILIPLVALLALTACSGTSSPQPAPTTASETTVPATTPSTLPLDVTTIPTGETVETVVIADGWSVKIAGTALEVLGTDIVAELEPVATATDLAALIEAYPGVLTPLLARMVSPDSAIGCTFAACFDAAGELERSWLLDPATIPGLGESYAAWQIPATLYVARFTAPVDAAARFASSTSGSVPVGAPAALSAAFGVSFSPVTSWASAEPSTPRSVYTSATPATLELSTIPFWNGLASTDPAARGLQAAQLTWMSSPTVGCGVSALCVPAEIESSVTVASTPAPLSVCDASGARAAVNVRDLRIKVSYPHPTHQAGMWNGGGPEFAGRATTSVKFAGTPPLVADEQEIRLVAFYWAGAAGLTQADGSLWQVGFDDPADVSRPVGEVVGRYFPNATWSLC